MEWIAYFLFSVEVVGACILAIILGAICIVVIADRKAERAVKRATAALYRDYNAPPGPSTSHVVVRKPTPYAGDIVASLHPRDFPPLPDKTEFSRVELQNQDCAADIRILNRFFGGNMHDQESPMPNTVYGSNEAIKAAADAMSSGNALREGEGVKDPATVEGTPEHQMALEAAAMSAMYERENARAGLYPAADGKAPTVVFSHFVYGKRRGALTVTAVALTRMARGTPDSSMTGNSLMDGEDNEPKMSEYSRPGGSVQHLSSTELSQVSPGGTHFPGATRVRLPKEETKE